MADPIPPGYNISVKKNIIANYFGRSYSILSIYIFIPFYIQILGIESYGIIAFSAVILTLISMADVGLSATFSREAARVKQPSRLFGLLTTIERILLLTTTAFSLALFFCAELIATQWLNTGGNLSVDEAANCLRILAISMPPQLVISLYMAGLLGLQHQVSANIFQIIFVSLRSGLVIGAITVHPALWVFFTWQLVVVFCAAFFGRRLLLARLGVSLWSLGNFNFSKLKPVINFAGGMMAISVIASLNTQLDKLAVSKIFSVSEFGHYALAGTLAQIPIAITSPIVAAVLPILTSFVAQNDRDATNHTYERYTFVVATISSFGAFGLFFFSSELLQLWLGFVVIPEPLVTVVQILAMGSLCLCLATLPFYLGIANGHVRTSLFLGLFTLVGTLPLIIIGTSYLGMVGAALPWLFLNLAALLAMSIVINHKYYGGSKSRWFFRDTALPSIVGFFTMWLAREFADFFDGSALAACAIAAVFGVASIGAVSYWAKRKLRLFDDVTSVT